MKEKYKKSESIQRIDSNPIVISPPKKRILASVRVELSPKDFKKRLPKPVISIESEARCL